MASEPEYKAILKKLSEALTVHLKATGAPRETTGDTPWDAWPYHGNHTWKIQPEPATGAEFDARETSRGKKPDPSQ